MSHTAIVKDCIDKLKRNTNFGKHGCSYYTFCGEDPFITYVLKQQPVLDVLCFVTLVEDLVEKQNKTLAKLVGRVDRYGLLLTSWHGAQEMPASCQRELNQQLDLWLKRYVPAAHQKPSRVNLAVALQQAGSHYTYKQDLWTWGIPILVAEVWDEVPLSLRFEVCTNLKASLHDHLRQYADGLLGCLRDEIGIYHIKSETVVARTLLFIIQAQKEQFDSRQSLFAWAEERLMEQIRLQISFHAAPNMTHEWGLEENKQVDLCEWVIRLRFLEAFHYLA